MKKQCMISVWCDNCQSNTHTTVLCRCEREQACKDKSSCSSDGEISRQKCSSHQRKPRSGFGNSNKHNAPNKSVVVIPTGIKGPLSNTPLGSLLLGRSSVGHKGLIVIPGIIDFDHVGEIRVMGYTINPPLFIPKGTKIAQLIALRNCQPCQEHR